MRTCGVGEDIRARQNKEGRHVEKDRAMWLCSVGPPAMIKISLRSSTIVGGGNAYQFCESGAQYVNMTRNAVRYDAAHTPPAIQIASLLLVWTLAYKSV